MEQQLIQQTKALAFDLIARSESQASQLAQQNQALGQMMAGIMQDLGVDSPDKIRAAIAELKAPDAQVIAQDVVGTD